MRRIHLRSRAKHVNHACRSSSWCVDGSPFAPRDNLADCRRGPARGRQAGAPRPERVNDAKGFDGYLAAQEHSLRELRRLPEFTLIEAIDALYDRSVRVLVPNSPPQLLQPLIACRQALLSAAAVIGRASPADALAITRRGIEAACLAVAVNHDPTNRDKERRG